MLAIDAGLHNRTVLLQSNVWKLKQPASHTGLQHRTADCERKQLTGRVAQIAAVVEPEDLTDHVAADRALSDHVFGEARKKLLEHLASAGQQSVQMSSLGDAFPRLIGVGKRVAFHHDHFAVMIGERTSREQAAHARTYDNCTLVGVRHSNNASMN